MDVFVGTFPHIPNNYTLSITEFSETLSIKGKTHVAPPKIQVRQSSKDKKRMVSEIVTDLRVKETLKSDSSSHMADHESPLAKRKGKRIIKPSIKKSELTEPVSTPQKKSISKKAKENKEALKRAK